MALRGYIGLRNLEQNSSYMIAMLQALFSCEHFYEYIIPVIFDRRLLHQRIANLFLAMNRRQDVTQQLRDFKDDFLITGNNRLKFTGNAEHDSQAFCNTLLNNLLAEDNDIDVVRVNTLAATSSEEAWNMIRYVVRNHGLLDIFGGLFHHVTRCDGEERHRQNIWNFFWTASLEIPSEDPNIQIIDVQHCLIISENSQTIDPDNCHKCGNQVRRTQKFAKMPQIFVIQLNLFRVENRIQHKIRAKIVINENIVLHENYYRLFALISHEGNSTTDGHYKTTRRRDRLSQQWIEFNDLIVTENLNESQLNNNLDLAYILFYAKSQEAVNRNYGHFETNQRQYKKAMTESSAVDLDLEINVNLPLTPTQPTDAQIDVNVSVQDIPPLHPIEPQQQQHEEYGQSTSGRQKRSADSESGPKRKRGRPPKRIPSPPDEPEHTESESRTEESGSKRIKIKRSKIPLPADEPVYRENVCAVRIINAKQEYVFRLHVNEEREYCVSYDEQQRNWYLFIHNCLYYSPLGQCSKTHLGRGYYLFWHNVHNCNLLYVMHAIPIVRSFRFIREFEIHSVLPFIYKNEIMCGLFIGEKPKQSIAAIGRRVVQRLWWRLGAETENSGIREFSVWNPDWFGPNVQRINSGHSVFGLFLYKGARLVMEDQTLTPEIAGINRTLLLDTTFIFVFGDLRIHLESSRQRVHDFSKFKEDSLITQNIDFYDYHIFFLRPLEDLAALWHMNLDYSQNTRPTSTSRHRTITRFVYLTVPQKADLNRISYMDWNEGLEFVKYEQNQRNWTTSVEYGVEAIANGLQLPVLYPNAQPPQQIPMILGRVGNYLP